MNTVLVVDDNPRMCRLIGTYLKQEGMTVLTAGGGREALELLRKETIHLLIADVIMPDLDGFALLEEVRKEEMEIPVLLLTAKDMFRDKKAGFELGADDYMTKPADLDELVLRAKALLRRSGRASQNRLTAGDLTLDQKTYELTGPKGVIEFPKKEFELLFLLLSFPRRIFTRRELMDALWSGEGETNERTVDVHIKRLREKTEHLSEFSIETVRGLGYKGVIYEKAREG